MVVFNSFKRSFHELRNIRCLATVGVFIAIFVVLDGFCSIRIGDFLKINFAYLALATIGMLFGPAVGLLYPMVCLDHRLGGHDLRAVSLRLCTL